jgi:hypothetical protein
VSATPTPTPTPTITPVVRRAPVRAYTSRDGWSIARPTGWRGARAESYTEWTRRDGNGHLGVEAVYANLDPHQLLRDAEESLRRDAGDVRSIGRRTVRHQGARAVEWEFTWTAGPGGGTPWAAQGMRYREVRRAVAIGDTAYILSWTVSEPLWQRNANLMRTVIASFTVGA